MLCGRAGELSQYSFCPVRHERQVPFPDGHALGRGRERRHGREDRGGEGRLQPGLAGRAGDPRRRGARRPAGRTRRSPRPWRSPARARSARRSSGTADRRVRNRQCCSTASSSSSRRASRSSRRGRGARGAAAGGVRDPRRPVAGPRRAAAGQPGAGDRSPWRGRRASSAPSRRRRSAPASAAASGRWCRRADAPAVRGALGARYRAAFPGSAPGAAFLTTRPGAAAPASAGRRGLAMKPLKIGISGVRGVVGETFTPELVVRFRAGLRNLPRPGRILVCRDTRPSGPMVAAAVIAGLLATGCDVVDLGHLPDAQPAAGGPVAGRRRRHLDHRRPQPDASGTR